ncbi:hypothetical protein CASFOL_001934 [Castilleja foliolosa]|uniref:TLC domain-containing protein n=1 Tax=Castilleja foliolosa TaxID=1961234 RepID=A0ABD3ECU5_9LAMI
MFFRVGTVILALHDASDVFLEGAKVFKYSGNELGASVFFGLFAVSWVILRLIFYPFWVIRSTRLLLPIRSLGPVTPILTLLVFHIYWWILMRQLKNRGQVGEDIQSDSEDDG